MSQPWLFASSMMATAQSPYWLQERSSLLNHWARTLVGAVSAKARQAADASPRPARAVPAMPAAPRI